MICRSKSADKITMQKSFWSYLVVVLAIFISCYWLGKKSRSAVPTAEVVADTNDTSSKNSVSSVKSVSSKSHQPVVIPNQPMAAWHTRKGGELFDVLFDQKAFVAFNAQDLAQVQARFFQPYPTLQPLYKAAMLERLGILKALEQQVPLRRGPSSVMAPELRGFYTQVLASPQENWLVKRQAFRNLHVALSAKEKESYYRTLDSRVIALASGSEQEILEGVLNETH